MLLISLEIAHEPNLDRLQYIIFSKKLLELVRINKVDAVVFEYIFMGKDPRVVSNLNKLRGVATKTIPKNIIILTDYLTKMRKEILGSGKRHTKRDVFYWARDRYNLIDFKLSKHNDITDAIFLAYWGYLHLTTNIV